MYSMIETDDLSRFCLAEMNQAITLLDAYARANSCYQGRYYAPLPEAWEDKGVKLVYNDFQNRVFLCNEEGELLCLDKEGVMLALRLPDYPFMLTAFEFAKEVNELLITSDKDSNSNEYSADGDAKDWLTKAFTLEDLSCLYEALQVCIEDYEHTLLDVQPLQIACGTIKTILDMA